MKRKKLQSMLEFLKTAADEMSKDERLDDWTDNLIFETAVEVTLNEFTAKGEGTPFANVDISTYGFCLNTDLDVLEFTVIHGDEETFDDD